jgi:hypothetical protein
MPEMWFQTDRCSKQEDWKAFHWMHGQMDKQLHVLPAITTERYVDAFEEVLFQVWLPTCSDQSIIKQAYGLMFKVLLRKE